MEFYVYFFTITIEFYSFTKNDSINIELSFLYIVVGIIIYYTNFKESHLYF